MSRSLAIAAATTAAAAAVLGTSAIGDAQVRRDDDYDAPTDTGVELVLGLWHDDTLQPGSGWHVYHFTAIETGHVAFQMRAPPGHATVWAYLRVVDRGRQWASVGNRTTNLCELIVPVARGRRYTVIATSQHTASLARGQRQVSDGPYTIAAVPVVIP